MRVLLTTWAGRSHFFPMVPLAWALRLAGHEVRVATQPGFAGVVTQAGLPVTVVGRDVDVAKVMRENIGRHMDRAVVPPDRWSAESDPDGRAAQLRRARLGLGHFVAIAEAMADDTVAFARSWRPDLVIFEPTTFAGPIAARVLGVPAARQLWTVDFTAQVGEIEMDLLGHLADRFGLDRLEVSGDWTVDPCPPRLQAPGPHAGDRVLAIRYVPYNGPAAPPTVDMSVVATSRSTSPTWAGGASRASRRARTAVNPRSRLVPWSPSPICRSSSTSSSRCSATDVAAPRTQSSAQPTSSVMRSPPARRPRP